MKLSIVCMGRPRERFIQDVIEKYLRYLKPYAHAELRVLREEKVDDLRDAPRVRKLEAAKIAKSLTPYAHIVALDERGREFTSHEFAAFMDKALENGVREMSFVLGGAMGLDESVTWKADMVLALSRWTLTHEMARLVLLEQLYRAFTIIPLKTIRHYFSDDMLTFFAAEDVASLSAAILEAYGSEEKRLAQARRARAFLERFGWPRHKQDLFDLYRSLSRPS